MTLVVKELFKGWEYCSHQVDGAVRKAVVVFLRLGPADWQKFDDENLGSQKLLLAHTLTNGLLVWGTVCNPLFPTLLGPVLQSLGVLFTASSILRYAKNHLSQVYQLSRGRLIKTVICSIVVSVLLALGLYVTGFVVLSQPFCGANLCAVYLNLCIMVFIQSCLINFEFEEKKEERELEDAYRKERQELEFINWKISKLQLFIEEQPELKQRWDEHMQLCNVEIKNQPLPQKFDQYSKLEQLKFIKINREHFLNKLMIAFRCSNDLLQTFTRLVKEEAERENLKTSYRASLR